MERRSAQIAARSPRNFRVCSIRCFRTSSTIGSFISRSPTTPRGSIFRGTRILRFRRSCGPGSSKRVVEMSEVPSNENVHAIYCGDSDVESILWIGAGYASGSDDLLGQRPSLLVNVEHAEWAQGLQPRLGLVWIAPPCFLVYQRRDVRLVLRTEPGPKFTGGFLVAGNDNVAAWAGSVITHKGRFDVCSSRHKGMVPDSCARGCCTHLLETCCRRRNLVQPSHFGDY